ncbi:3502_t:CDS:2, partial [Racocetra fulgida]
MKIKDKEKSAKNKQSDSEKAINETIFVQDISDYIASAIADLEIQLKLSLAFYIQIDEITLNIVGTDVKAIAILIVDEIENGDRYNWIATTVPNLSSHYHDIGN